MATQFRSRGKGSNRKVIPITPKTPTSIKADLPVEKLDHDIPYYLKGVKSFAKRFAYLALMSAGAVGSLKEGADMAFVYPYFYDLEKGPDAYIPTELAREYMRKGTRVGFVILSSCDNKAEDLHEVEVTKGYTTANGKYIHVDSHTDNFTGLHAPEKWRDMADVYTPIPKELRDYHFMKLGNHNKVPFEPNWETTQNYDWKNAKILRHVTEGGNYGVLLGPYEDRKGPYQLIVVDADTPELNNYMRKDIKTFTVGHDGGGAHYYFKVRDAHKNITKTVIKDKKTDAHLGDLMGYHSQVVAPGSIHANGSEYRVIDPSPIKDIEWGELESTLSRYQVGRKE